MGISSLPLPGFEFSKGQERMQMWDAWKLSSDLPETPLLQQDCPTPKARLDSGDNEFGFWQLEFEISENNWQYLRRVQAWGQDWRYEFKVVHGKDMVENTGVNKNYPERAWRMKREGGTKGESIFKERIKERSQVGSNECVPKTWEQNQEKRVLRRKIKYWCQAR